MLSLRETCLRIGSASVFMKREIIEGMKHMACDIYGVTPYQLEVHIKRYCDGMMRYQRVEYLNGEYIYND